MSAPLTFAYARLPIQPEEGFPQAFRLVVAGTTYGVALYVNVCDERVLTGGALDLPIPGAFLVMTVERQGPVPAVPIFRRKLVPSVEYRAHELAFVFTRMLVDVRNLNGAGRYGSQVVGGVATRWVS